MVIRNAITQTAHLFCGHSVPVCVLAHGRKRPFARPADNSLWVVDDSASVDVAFTQAERNGGTPNLGIMIGWQKQSAIIGVGLDSYKNKAVMDLGKSLGLSNDIPAWIQRTGRGGWTFFFYYNHKKDLMRLGPASSDANDPAFALDLLTNGYAIVAPSTTSLEGGGPYRWATGHSPADIPVAELGAMPEPLLEYWLNQMNARHVQQGSPSVGPIAGGNGSSTWLQRVLTTPIPDGARDITLTSIMGGLHRKFPPGEALSMLQTINMQCCNPPLSDRDIVRIAESILRRPGNESAPLGGISLKVRRE